MNSKIADALMLRLSPVAIIFSDSAPDNGVQCHEGYWQCVIEMLVKTARGRTAIFNRERIGCPGGSVGLCFGNVYEIIPIEDFLSSGSTDGCIEGEGYKKSPELAKSFIDKLPTVDIPFKYVIFKPLSEVNQGKEKPRLVVFLANPDQISALVVLANYGRPGNDSVIVPWGAACHTICLIPFEESKKDLPRAVIGITDITARPFVQRDALSFTVPFKMFLEMEANVSGSFLEKDSWKKLTTTFPYQDSLGFAETN